MIKDFLPVLEGSRLFRGTTAQEIEEMLSCLSARLRQYEKNEYALHAGESADAIGMVLSGSVYILKEDFWGNRNIMSKVGAGELFAEAYACVGKRPLGVSVVAGERTSVMLLDVGKVFSVCSCSCHFHSRLIENLLSALAEKNLLLSDKLTHMSRRSTREKLLSYLSQCAQTAGSSSFEIPFNRQQLADYLSVDRSAMSNELCKMRDEGLLRFSRSSFELKL